jgi:hypothetical protein
MHSGDGIRFCRHLIRKKIKKLMLYLGGRYKIMKNFSIARESFSEEKKGSKSLTPYLYRKQAL